MKRAARCRRDAARDAQVLDRLLDGTDAETGARRILPGHVRHDRRLHHLLRDANGLLELARFHMREVELAEQQHLGRWIGAGLRQALGRVLRAKTR